MQLEVFLGNFKYFIGLIAYIYGIEAVDDDERPQIEYVKELEFCSSSRCLGRGECYLDEYHEPQCHCYKQYYKGANCTETSDACGAYDMFEVPWIPPCHKLYAKQCSATYGASFCRCHPGFTGRICADETSKLLPEGDIRLTDDLKFAEDAAIYMDLEPKIYGTASTLHIGVTVASDTVDYGIQADGLFYFLKRKGNDTAIFTENTFDSAGVKSSVKTLTGKEFTPHGFWHKENIIFTKTGNKLVTLIQIAMLPAKRNHYFARKKEHTIPYLYKTHFQYHATQDKKDCIPSIEFAGGACSQYSVTSYFGVSKRMPLKLIYNKRKTCNVTNLQDFKLTYIIHDFEQKQVSMPEKILDHIKNAKVVLDWEKSFTVNQLVKDYSKNEKAVDRLFYAPKGFDESKTGKETPYADDIQLLPGTNIVIFGKALEKHSNESYNSKEGFGTCFITYLRYPRLYANIDKIRSDGAFIAKGDNITFRPQIRTGDNDYKNFNWLVYNKYFIEINWMIEKVRWNEMCPHDDAKADDEQPNCYEDICPPRGMGTEKNTDNLLIELKRFSTCSIELTVCLQPVLWSPDVKDGVTDGFQKTYITSNKQKKSKMPTHDDKTFSFCTSHLTQITADDRELPFVYFKCIRNCGSGITALDGDITRYDVFDLIILQLTVEQTGDNLKRVKNVLIVDLLHSFKPVNDAEYFYQEPPDKKELLIYNAHAFESIESMEGRSEKHEINIIISLNQQASTKWLLSPFMRTDADVTELLCPYVSQSGAAIHEEFTFCSKRILPDDYGYVLYYQKMSEYKSNEALPGSMTIAKLNFREVLLGFLLTYGVDPYIPGNWIASSPLFGFFYVRIFNDLHKAEWKANYFTELHVHPPRERQFGPLNHINLLRDLVKGWSKGVSSVDGDIEARNVMILVQKLHAINIELVHLAKVTNLEDTVYIDATRIVLNKEFIKIGTVMLSETFEVIQIFSLLHELIMLSSLPLSAENCQQYATVLSTFSSSLQSTVTADTRFKKKIFFVKNTIYPILDCFHGLVYPSRADEYEALDDQIAKIIAHNTQDELNSGDHVNEFYSVYDVAFDVMDKDRDKYGVAMNDAIAAMKSAMDLLRSTLTHFLIDKVEKPLSNYTNKYLKPMEIHAPDRKYMVYAFLGNFTLLEANPFGIICKDRLAIDIQLGTKMTSSDQELKFVIFITETNPYWWENHTKHHIDSVVYLHLTASGKVDKKAENETAMTHDSRRSHDSKKSEYSYELPPIDKNANNGQYRFVTRYYLPEILTSYGGVANDIVPDWAQETLLTCFVTIITKDMPSRIYAIFNSDMQTDIYVTMKTGTMPSTMEAKSKHKIQIGQENGVYTTFIDVAKDDKNRADKITLYMVVIPKGEDAVPFHFIFVGVECSVWAERKITTDNVKIDNGSELISASQIKDLCYRPEYDYENNYVSCDCITRNNIGFTMRHVIPTVRLHGFLSMEIDFQMSNTMMLPLIAGSMFLLFCGLFFAGYFMDGKDTEKKIPIYIVTNRPKERYEYIIVTITGADRLARTTSHVGIKLYGVKGNSKRHILTGAAPHTKIFHRRQVDLFCLTTAECLGNIRSVELWIDHRGTRPSWYLEKVMVRDYFRMIEWVFMARKWFSLVQGDIMLHRFLYQTQLKKENKKAMLFRIEDFYLHHYWFGMLSREHCHSYSRKAKVLAAGLIMSIGSFTAMIYVGCDVFDAETPLDEGHFHTDIALRAGFWGLVMGVAFGYPIIYALKNANPDPNYVYYYSDFSGIDPTLPRLMYQFGYTTKIFMTTVQVAVIMGATFFQILAGMYFGTRKSYIYLVAVITCFCVDLCLVENVHVVVRGIIYNFWMKMPDAQRFCNEIIYLHFDDQIPLANKTNKHMRLHYDMLKPVPNKVKRVLKRKEENFKAFRVSIFDFFFFLILFLVNVYLFDFYHSPYGIYSTKVLYHTLIDETYAGTMGFLDVNTYNLFFKYLNGTLLFSLHWQPPGFTVMTNLKVIGVVRLRQLKNQPGKGDCWPPAEFGQGIIDRCDLDFSPSIMDRKSYNPYWTAFNQSIPMEEYRRDPFIYRDGDFVGSGSKMVDYAMLPGDGYIAYLGRTPSNTRTALNFLVRSRWFSSRTRYVFMDVICYNVHTNLFTTLTMALGFSRSGDIVRFYHLNAFRAFEVYFHRALLQYALYIFFAIQCANIIARHIHQVKHCFYRIQAFQDTLVMFLCITTLILYALRFIGFRDMLAEFEALKLNRFISMDHLISLEYWSIITTGLLCSQNLSHLVDILHGNKHVRIFYFMILYAMSPLVICVALTLIFLISFSCCFHFMVGHQNEMYRSLLLAYVETFALPFSSPTPTIKFKFETIPTLIPYWVFTFYGYTFRFLISNMFSVVMVNSYHRARFRLYRHCFQYSLGLYIKERILGHSIIYDMPRKTTMSSQQVDRKIEAEKLAKEERKLAAAESGDIGGPKEKGTKKKSDAGGTELAAAEGAVAGATAAAENVEEGTPEKADEDPPPEPPTKEE